jgi:hypothetical protein
MNIYCLVNYGALFCNQPPEFWEVKNKLLEGNIGNIANVGHIKVMKL